MALTGWRLMQYCPSPMVFQSWEKLLTRFFITDCYLVAPATNISALGGGLLNSFHDPWQIHGVIT